MTIEKVIYLKVLWEKYIIWVRVLKNWRLPHPVNCFPLFSGKNIKIAHPVNYAYYLPVLDRCLSPGPAVGLWCDPTWSPSACMIHTLCTNVYRFCVICMMCIYAWRVNMAGAWLHNSNWFAATSSYMSAEVMWKHSIAPLHMQWYVLPVSSAVLTIW